MIICNICVTCVMFIISTSYLSWSSSNACYNHLTPPRTFILLSNGFIKLYFDGIYGTREILPCNPSWWWVMAAKRVSKSYWHFIIRMPKWKTFSRLFLHQQLHRWGVFFGLSILDYLKKPPTHPKKRNAKQLLLKHYQKNTQQMWDIHVYLNEKKL